MDEMESRPLQAPASPIAVTAIRPGMEVCDVNGEKVGTVAQLYRPVLPPTDQEGERSPRSEVVEVKTGLLGLGAHYYIPRSAFQEALRDSAYLTKAKDEITGLNWDRKPDFLEPLG